MGTILRRVWRYDMHPLDRFPSVPAGASDARLVQCRKASGGHRLGTSGKTIGNAHRKWAFAEAATRCLPHKPQGQKRLSRGEKTPHQGKALSSLAHTRGRALYSRRKRHTAVEMDRCLRSDGRRAGAPGASLDSSGDEPASSTPDVRLGCGVERQGGHRTRLPAPWRVLGHPRGLRPLGRVCAQGSRGLPRPRT
jgi:hypothetical protein